MCCLYGLSRQEAPSRCQHQTASVLLQCSVGKCPIFTADVPARKVLPAQVILVVYRCSPARASDIWSRQVGISFKSFITSRINCIARNTTGGHYTPRNFQRRANAMLSYNFDCPGAKPQAVLSFRPNALPASQPSMLVPNLAVCWSQHMCCSCLC